MNCRFCNSPLNNMFVSLCSSPLANSYLTKEQLQRVEPYYPLDIYVCDKCFLVQLEEFEHPEDIFGDYAYFSSYSDSWLQHAKQYVDNITDMFDINRNSFVLEIASNDGYLLQYFKESNIPMMGIEPAANIAKVAIEKGIPTDIAFFSSDYAKALKNNNKLSDLIVGNNVLAHNPNLNDFVEGLCIALKPDGIITMEFPHLMKLIDEVQFDTIYHEHFSYFSFLSVEKVFATHGITLFDVEELSTHGGSLRIYGKHSENNIRKVGSRVHELRQREVDAGYRDIDFYRSFGEKVKTIKRNVLKFLIEAKDEGKTVVGYGAPAKGNTLLNYCGIRSDFIDYTVDRSPYKQGHYLPGTHIAIESPDKFRETKPDYVFILPWNIKDEIMGQMSFIREWGGKFVVAIPEVKVI